MCNLSFETKAVYERSSSGVLLAAGHLPRGAGAGGADNGTRSSSAVSNVD